MGFLKFQIWYGKYVCKRNTCSIVYSSIILSRKLNEFPVVQLELFTPSLPYRLHQIAHSDYLNQMLPDLPCYFRQPTYGNYWTATDKCSADLHYSDKPTVKFWGQHDEVHGNRHQRPEHALDSVLERVLQPAQPWLRKARLANSETSRGSSDRAVA